MRSNPGHRLLVFVLLLAAAAAVVIATGRTPSDGGTGSSSVFIVGDSLTVGALDFIPEAMEQRGIRLAGVDARNGRTTPQGLEVLREQGDALPGTVLVALGTNDVYFATEESVAEWMATAREIVGDRRLIWVNTHVIPERAEIEALERWDDVNAWLAAAAPRHDIELADWAVWAAINGVEVGPDGVHYEDTASARRAGFYADVVAGRVQTIE
jgi:lysophospholipase L1-like esterase